MQDGREVSSPATACVRGHFSWAHPMRGVGRAGADRPRGCWSRLGPRQDFLGEEQKLSGIDPPCFTVALPQEQLEVVLKLLVEMDLLDPACSLSNSRMS